MWTLGWAHSNGQSSKCLMKVVYYCSVHHGKQMAPGEMEPLPVSHKSTGGQTLEETATLVDAYTVNSRGRVSRH